MAVDSKLEGNSYFIISIDFELFWGVFDTKSKEKYGQNIQGVHEVIPKMLSLFNEFEIHATWATVGMLFFNSLTSLRDAIPVEKPSYTDPSKSSYHHLQMISENDFKKYYCGLDLISLIGKAANQEIATHTFSHFYCLEPGQTFHDFEHDLKSAISVAYTYGFNLTSIVFPRNQVNCQYLPVCKNLGITAYRGTEDNFLQKPRQLKKFNYFIRFIRFLDSYINITGYNTIIEIKKDINGLYNIPASFFFRPFKSSIFNLLQILKLRRLKKSMSYAAKNNESFHLWWHPHNFGINQEENLEQLRSVLLHYQKLNEKYNMRSLNMSEIVSTIESK